MAKSVNDLNPGTKVNNLKIIRNMNGRFDLEVECCVTDEERCSNYTGTLDEDDVWKCMMNNTIKEGYIYATFEITQFGNENHLVYIG